jgi:tRNA U34 5-carboxymethylaminomethyl modifying enzyme MnmG/GidA
MLDGGSECFEGKLLHIGCEDYSMGCAGVHCAQLQGLSCHLDGLLAAWAGRLARRCTGTSPRVKARNVPISTVNI